MANDYVSQATNQYDPTYNSKVTAAKNQLAQQLAGYDAQKGALGNQYNQSVQNTNQNFQTEVDNQNQLNVRGQNNYSNTMLGRGLDRSSIVTTGLGEMDNLNKQAIGQIDTKKNQQLQTMQNAYNNSLSGIEGQRQTAINNEANVENTMASDRAQAIADLARQLEDRQWTKDYQQKQLDAQTSYQNGLLANARAQQQSYANQQKQQDLQNGMSAIDSIVGQTGASSQQKVNYLNDYANQMTNLGYPDLAKYALQQMSNLAQGAYGYSTAQRTNTITAPQVATKKPSGFGSFIGGLLNKPLTLNPKWNR